MKEKDKLKKLVEIIGDLLKIEGNEWLIDEMLRTIGEKTPIEEIAKHSIIQNIHEYCVEQKIEKQATEFYMSFPIEELKPQLIEDYKKMEHERRRDDFEGFCLSMFQQIEAIVNYCFESSGIKEKLKKDRNSSAFIEWNLQKKAWERTSNQRLIPFLLIKINKKYENDKSLPFFDLNTTDEEKYFDQNGHPIIDFNPNKKSWSFLNRYRTILFYLYFNSRLKQIDFDGIYSLGSELYTIRNKNHRESKATPSQQKIIVTIKGKESKYYFKFYGFLQDFVSHIELTLGKNKQELLNRPLDMKKAQKLKTSNTLGENSKLSELFKKLKENE